MNTSPPTAKRDVRSWVPTLYFTMGLPFVMLNMVAVLMFNNMGISDGTNALVTSLLLMPWTLKFIWSPFLERFRSKKLIVITMQIASGIGFGLVALCLHLPIFFAVAISALAVVAVCGATYDIAADGLYMQELDTKQQATYVGWQGACYNLSKLVASGALVYLAGTLTDFFGGGESRQAVASSWMIIMLIAAAVMVGLGFYHMRMLPAGKRTQKEGGESVTDSFRHLWAVVRLFLTKKHIVYYLCWIFAYRFCEGFVIKIVPLFLKASTADGGLGISEQEIGLYYGSFGSAAFVLGSLMAGVMISRRGLKRSIFILCCAFNLPFLVYTAFACLQPTHIAIIGSGITLEYFGYGFGFVGLTLFIMQQIAKGEHQMSHYAIGTALMNFSVMLTGSVSGYISDALGYKTFFIVIMLAMIPAFILTWYLPFTHSEDTQKTS